MAVVAMLAGAGRAEDVPKAAADTARSIEGTYLLYQQDNPDGGLVCKLAITSRNETDFLVFGVDQPWSGEGRIEGKTGYYHWVFVDGARGKTTFTINADGTLTGKVRGEVLEWTYLARRSHDKAEAP
jgi:hypothetical protein